MCELASLLNYTAYVDLNEMWIFAGFLGAQISGLFGAKTDCFAAGMWTTRGILHAQQNITGGVWDNPNILFCVHDAKTTQGSSFRLWKFIHHFNLLCFVEGLMPASFDCFFCAVRQKAVKCVPKFFVHENLHVTIVIAFTRNIFS
jgi:hypothetical protein